MDTAGKLTIWWDEVPPEVRRSASASAGDVSNIHRKDYVGPQACKKCHQARFEAWSDHPHRRMNALADETTVLGDFSGDSGITNLGGRAEFERVGGRYRMRLSRDGTSRAYDITQTIGSRFFQYYIGRQTEGPPPPSRPSYQQDHVLPFGYWLEERQWVPIVHVGEEEPDGKRIDPFDAASLSKHFNQYSISCNGCHTTFPLGDMMVRLTKNIGRHAPREMHLFTSQFLASAHPEIWDGQRDPRELTDPEMMTVMHSMIGLDARRHAVTLGVSCEACHLGARAHADGTRKRPSFFPLGPELLVTGSGNIETGRTRQNVNWVCGRCHTGGRPELAAGMSTWNSTEFDDAMKGSCYSELTCIHCHDPHKATGQSWPRTAAEDDALCIKCHTKFKSATKRQSHTHHAPGNGGDRCMNCHMPRLNEGLQDIVRTHMIFSPTNREMIESGQPNACNLCHTDKSINWTIGYLSNWYGVKYAGDRIASEYPLADSPASINWVNSRNEAVRLIAADALCRTNSKFALPHLIKVLDDPFLINRQFTQRRLGRMLGIHLRDFGYQFYMTPSERRAPLKRLRAELLPDSKKLESGK